MPKESDMQGEQHRREVTYKASDTRKNGWAREEMGKGIEVCEGRDVQWKRRVKEAMCAREATCKERQHAREEFHEGRDVQGRDV